MNFAAGFRDSPHLIVFDALKKPANCDELDAGAGARCGPRRTVGNNLYHAHGGCRWRRLYRYGPEQLGGGIDAAGFAEADEPRRRRAAPDRVRGVEPSRTRVSGSKPISASTHHSHSASVWSRKSAVTRLRDSGRSPDGHASPTMRNGTPWVPVWSANHADHRHEERVADIAGMAVAERRRGSFM